MTKEEMQAIAKEYETKRVKYAEYKNLYEKMEGIVKGEYFADTKEVEILYNSRAITLELSKENAIFIKLIFVYLPLKNPKYKSYQMNYDAFKASSAREQRAVIDAVRQLIPLYALKEHEVFEKLEELQNVKELKVESLSLKYTANVEIKVENVLDLNQEQGFEWIID